MKTTFTKEAVATEMAAYFTENITVAELLEWVGSITFKISDAKEMDEELKGETIFFTTHVLPNVAATLIRCKTEIEMKEAIKTEVLHLFVGMDYVMSKKVLQAICNTYLENFVRQFNDSDEINEFFKIFASLMPLCEMFRRYETLKNNEQESVAA